MPYPWVTPPFTNMNTLETHILELIGEYPDTPDVFTDSDSGLEPIRESINDATEEITMLTGTYKETYRLALREDQGVYRLDWGKGQLAWITDCWLMGQKIRLEQTDIIRLNHFNPRWLMNSGSPKSYMQIGFDWIILWPRPSADSDIVEVSGVVIPGRTSSSTDRLKMRESFHWATVHYAVGEFWASRGDAKSAIYHHTKYLKKLGINATYPLSAEDTLRFQTNKEPWPKKTG
jgi:hypothetical protein